MNGILLDTDTCVDLLRDEPGAVAWARGHSPSEFAASILTRYELLYGVECCDPRRRERERAKVLLFLSAVREAPFTRQVADLAARIRADLRRSGESIGAIDLLLAATALTENRTLATRNEKEFARVPGLSCLNWSH